MIKVVNSLKEVLQEHQEGKVYSLLAVVDNVIRGVDRNGSPYLTLRLINQNDAIVAKCWNANESDFQILSQGNLVAISGRMSHFRNVPQLVIDEAQTLNDQDILQKLLPTPPIPLKRLKEEFLGFFAKVTDPEYRKLLDYVFNEKVLQNFSQSRAGLKIHHNVLGGLLWHTVSMLKAALALLPIYSYLPINRSLLYTGIIFHDFGKIVEIGDFFQSSYSLDGKLLGHIVIASEQIGQIGLDLKISPQKIKLLQHLILASHGKFENGSPREPIVLEAFLLSQLDFLDAKMGVLFNNWHSFDDDNFTAPFVLHSENPLRKTSFWKHFSKEDK